jgi:hypothetical protein
MAMEVETATERVCSGRDARAIQAVPTAQRLGNAVTHFRPEREGQRRDHRSRGVALESGAGQSARLGLLNRTSQFRLIAALTLR